MNRTVRNFSFKKSSSILYRAQLDEIGLFVQSKLFRSLRVLDQAPSSFFSFRRGRGRGNGGGRGQALRRPVAGGGQIRWRSPLVHHPKETEELLINL